MPFGHKAGLPPSKKYLLVRQPLLIFTILYFLFSLVQKTAVSTSAAPCPAAGPLIPGRKPDEP